MKIGLVTPYVYPLPGGVTQHVRLPLREPPPARPRRPDPDLVARPPAGVRGRRHPDRQGLLAAGQRLGRDDHPLAPVRLPGPGHARARAVRPAPLPRAVRAVPLADHPPPLDERERRDLPRLRRLLAVVRVRPAGHGRLRRAPPRPDRGQRRGEALHRPLLPRRVQGHPERRRRRPVPAGRADRPLAGRHAQPPVRRPVRAAQGPARAAQGVPDPAQDRLRLPAARRRPRARSAGRPGATSRRGGWAASSSSAGSATTRRPSSSGRPTSTSRRRPAASRSGSSCSRRWPRARRSSRPTSTATRASSGAAARPSSSSRASRRQIAAAVARLLRDDELRTEMGRAGLARAQEFSWERVTAKVDDFYGVVIRRLAARGELPAGFHAPIPPSPRALPGSSAADRRRPTAVSRLDQPRPTPLEHEPEPELPSRRRPPAAEGRPTRPAPPTRPRPPTRPTRPLRRLALGEGDPPDPRRVGETRQRKTTAPAEHERRPGRAAGRPSRRSRPVVHRELERVEVGRQDALVDVRDRRSAAAGREKFG